MVIYCKTELLHNLISVQQEVSPQSLHSHTSEKLCAMMSYHHRYIQKADLKNIIHQTQNQIREVGKGGVLITER